MSARRNNVAGAGSGSGCPPMEMTPGNLGNEFKKWLQSFRLYLRASKLDEESDNRKVALFLHLIGQRGIEIFNSFGKDDEKIEFDDLVTLFTDYFIPKDNLTFNCHNFFAYKQKENESLEDFACTLKIKSQSCKFEKLQDRLIKVMFICNMHSKYHFIRERLLQDDSLDFEKALEMAKTMLTSKYQAGELQESTVMFNTRRQQLRSRSRTGSPSTRRSTSPKQDNHSQKTCTRCGQVHRVKCPALSAKCRKCNKYGHYEVCCRTVREEEEERSRKCVAACGRADFCSRCGGDKHGGVIPCICQHHRPVKFETGGWFLRQAQRGLSLMPWSLSTDKLEQIDEECEPSAGSSGERGDLHNVREFLEALSAKLAGGTLEGTRVAPLYDHPAYLPSSHNATSSASSGRPSTGASGAHAQLKRLVARVVEEAAALPALARYAAEPHSPTEASTYEDLLATAILNKVIERYQTENGSGGRSSGIHSASASPSPSERSSPRSLTSRNTRDITPPLREEVDVSDWEEGEATDDALELPRRVPFPEFGGDIVHQTDNEDRDFDEVSSSDIQAVDGSWEENWLFQKKKIKTIQSVPVPMLVPNSNTEYRALIGDRDAEDTTDLSDNASDAEEQETEFKSDIKKVLDSKHVIGGKPKVDEVLDFEPDSLMSVDGSEEFEKLYNEYKQSEDTVDAVKANVTDSSSKVIGNIEDTPEKKHDSILLLSVDSGPLPKAEFNVKEEIHRTLLNGSAEDFTEDQPKDISFNEEQNVLQNKEYQSNTNTNTSRHEREGEYEETVSVPVQRYADSLRRKHFEDESQQSSVPSFEKEDELIPGSIAYRERKKWLNYVDMPNNPYSPEAIKKRLSAKSTSSLFDSLTTKTNLDDEKIEIPDDTTDVNGFTNRIDDTKVSNGKSALSVSTGNISMIDRRSASPSTKILKDVLAEEIPQYKRYGRDYYIKEAKKSSGGRNKNSFSDTCSLSSSINKSTSLDNFETEFASPGLLIQQFNNIATNQHYKNFAGQEQMHNSITTIPQDTKNEILIEYEDINEQTLFSAKPVIVDDDTDKKFEEILQSAYKTDIAPLTVEIDKPHDEPAKSPENVDVENSYSSSSLEDSIKIYNVQTGEIVKCKPDDKVSPRYEQAPDRNDNIDIPDKNIPGETVDRLSSNDNAAVEQAPITEPSKEEKLPHISEIEEILQNLPKVKELAKKFVSMENLSEQVKPPPQPHIRRRRSRDNFLNSDDKSTNKVAYMHSLTARSISKEFRDELKLSMATPLTVPGGSKEIPEGTEGIIKESSRPGSPLPEPGTIKTKLAFFESLKSKFSTK